MAVTVALTVIAAANFTFFWSI